MIEDAYRLGERTGLSVWCSDQAGPFQTAPYPGQSRQPEGRPALLPHEYIRNGTAKVLTLFHPADGRADPEQIKAWFKAVAGHWNEDPTPFEWGGKRAARRQRQRERRHRLGGSGARTRRPVPKVSPHCYGHGQRK